MDADNWQKLVDRLRERDITFVDGLTDAEVVAVEAQFGFRFPPDLRAFLQTALPQGEDFPDWRSGTETDLREWLDLPRRGVIFDIESNGFWLEEWGERPTTLDEAKQVAEKLIGAAPRLIPIYSHRMMPAEPHLPGNPVFSVHQTDIIVYGVDLKDYLNHEFLVSDEESTVAAGEMFDEPVPQISRPITFWNIDRFQEVRWADGPCLFDNSRGLLPESETPDN